MPPSATPARSSRSGRRAPRRTSPEQLERSALSYLDRYSSTRANLRRVLLRKAERSCAHHGDDLSQAEAWIEALIDKLTGLRLLDDRRYAEDLLRRLRRRGNSARMVRVRMREKGVPDDIAGELLRAESDGESDGDASEGTVAGADPELTAARAYARRRGFGRYRRAPLDEARRERELGAFARAGFGYPVAERVIDETL